MAYLIEYNTVSVRQAVISRRRKNQRLAAWLLGGAALAAVIAWPEARAALGQLFFPGADAATARAMEAFAADLAAGEPIGEAVYGFCQEILGAMGA